MSMISSVRLTCDTCKVTETQSFWVETCTQSMRFVIQRVLSASVSVDSKVISSINRGVCVLVGINKDDTIKDGERLISKLLGMRLWPDTNDRPWRESLVNRQYEILFVSQFTLYARMKGTKPDYSHAMTPKDAEKLYNQFLDLAKSKYDSNKIFDGKFGAKMNVKIENDGPVTICLNTDDSVAKQKKDPNSKRSKAKKEHAAFKKQQKNNNDKDSNQNDEKKENDDTNKKTKNPNQSNMSLQSVASSSAQLGSFFGATQLPSSNDDPLLKRLDSIIDML